jgi:hypothetical protein
MEPKLGGEGVPINMNMRRFMQIVTDKVEPVRSGPQDGWGHLPIPLLSLLAAVFIFTMPLRHCETKTQVSQEYICIPSLHIRRSSPRVRPGGCMTPETIPIDIPHRFPYFLAGNFSEKRRKT